MVKSIFVGIITIRFWVLFNLLRCKCNEIIDSSCIYILKKINYALGAQK